MIGRSMFACASYLWALRLLPQSLSDPTGGFSGGVYASIRAVPLDRAMRSDLTPPARGVVTALRVAGYLLLALCCS